MKKLFFIFTSFIFILSSCQTEISKLGYPRINRFPENIDAKNFYREIDDIKDKNLYYFEYLDMDLRTSDLSSLDLSEIDQDLSYATFGDETIWPDKNFLPDEYDPNLILELGKNPGLGIRSLHKNGITGKGIGIGVIDQPLLIDHQEYASQIQYYFELDDIDENSSSSMHGSAVVSTAVGKNCGVAPDANIFYIATSFGYFNNHTSNYEYTAEAIYKLLELNKELPKENQIRVIAIQKGFGSDEAGYDAVMEAIEKAMSENVFVISSSLRFYSDFNFNGMGRYPYDNPDDFESYRPGNFWAINFYQNSDSFNQLMIPMDSKTLASSFGNDKYDFFRDGGWSWVTPYLAGVYALAVQVEPNLTPELFWEIALDTGIMTEIEHEGQIYEFGPIINPVGLIEALEK